MIDFFYALPHNPFLWMSFLVGCAACITSGIVGSFVVTKRITFLSGSISHSVLGGIGLFIFLRQYSSFPLLHSPYGPLYGGVFFALLSAWLIGWIHLKYRQREDTVIAALWAFGMSVGVILLSLSPGYQGDLYHFLFGNLLWSTKGDLCALLLLDGVLAIATWWLYYPLLALCFDEEYMRLQGKKTLSLYFFFLSLTGIAIVLLLKIVGAILVIAMLSLPAAIANLFTKRFSSMLFFSSFFALIINIVGQTFAFSRNWPPGASIALTATVLYFISLLGQKIYKALSGK